MSWESALADFESKIAAAELALTDGQPFADDVLHPFVPPVDLGPFPSELQEWATSVLTRNENLTRNLRKAMDSLEAEIVGTQKEATVVKRYYPSSDSAVPKYFDKPV